MKTLKHDRDVVVFFDRHRWLLSDPRFATEAHLQLALHRRRLERALAHLAEARSRQLALHLASLRSETPQAAICRVFGPYCGQALQVARCESRLHTNAQNGQYLGLFQMGTSERRLFGHGDSAEAQAVAAHRYFLASGRSWSPWSCKPW